MVNGALIERLTALVSILRAKEVSDRGRPPNEVAFQALMELAPRKAQDDTPPPRPEGVFREDSPPLPTYSRMMTDVLDQVNKTLDDRRVGKNQRYGALIQELGSHFEKIQHLQTDLARNLDELEQQGSKKITSESYHVGFNSSHINKAGPGDKARQDTEIELLNLNYNMDKATADTGVEMTKTTTDDSDEKVRASPAAKKFAEINPADYRASHAYLSSHPEILLNESETDGLLIEAYYAILDQHDETRAWHFIHQALLLQYCRMLGRDGVALFFKRISAPSHRSREAFEKDVAERFQKIRGMAKRDAKQRAEAAEGDGAVAQIQLHPVGLNGSVRIEVPLAESEDREVRKAREMFERFAPEMRAALESGSLDEVNKVLGGMEVEEAENLVSLLGEVSGWRYVSRCPGAELTPRCRLAV